MVRGSNILLVSGYKYPYPVQISPNFLYELNRFFKFLWRELHLNRTSFTTRIAYVHIPSYDRAYKLIKVSMRWQGVVLRDNMY